MAHNGDRIGSACWFRENNDQFGKWLPGTLRGWGIYGSGGGFTLTVAIVECNQRLTVALYHLECVSFASDPNGETDG